MKKEDTTIDTVPTNLSFTERPEEGCVIHEGIEFKQASYKFMFEVPFFRCSHSINYFHIEPSDWRKFKVNLQEVFTDDFLGCAQSMLLFIILPESIKQNSTATPQETNKIFSIDKELKKRFGEAFFFHTSFTSSQFCEAFIMLCDKAPKRDDYLPEYHRGTGEPWDFFEICHHCQSPCRILHFCIQCPKNEIDKLPTQVHNTINESYLTDPSIVSIIQLGLPYSSLTAEEWRIIPKSFETFGSKQPIGIGASLAENMIEANVYLISNPFKDKIFNQ